MCKSAKNVCRENRSQASGALYKVRDTMHYILITKKQYTFLYVNKYIIYGAVLIPKYKRTYDQSDQIEKISSSSLLRIGPIPTINKEFLLHTSE